MNSMTDIISSIQQAKNIILTAHIRPDGDAIGACLGLRRILANAGFSVSILDLTPIPERYSFLPLKHECRSSDDFDFSSVDLIIVLDAGSLDRCPEFVAHQRDNITIINIDHHLSNTQFGNLNFVDNTASSVGEILCRLAQKAAWQITTSAAEALWVSIVTDTGRFSYSNTTPATMRAAAVLLEKDIHPANINHAIYNRVPLRQIKLQGRAIDNLSLHEHGQLALTELSANDFAAMQCTPADTEEIVNIPRNIEGVAVAVFLYELSDKNEAKVSLRTAEPYDAAALCRTLGGGGHARAAGCSIPGNLADAHDKILKIIHNQWFSNE